MAKNFRGKNILVAKKFREIFFENNTIHLRGKKFVAKNFRGKKFSWQKNICGKKSFETKKFSRNYF